MTATEWPADDGRVIMNLAGALHVISLDRPQRRNALSPTIRDALIAALDAAMNDSQCRVVVLTGAGGHFCSGGDIGSFAGMNSVSGRARMQHAQGLVRALAMGEKPVIAAVEGHAAGAGLCLAAACDIVVASTQARFSCNFNRIGLIPDNGGLWSIPQRIGMGRAKVLMFSGRMLDAHEAERQGLADMLCEPGTALAVASSLATEIAGNAPTTHAMIKAILARGPMPLDALLRAEADAQGVLYGSADLEEGRQAFLDKRPPIFLGC